MPRKSGTSGKTREVARNERSRASQVAARGQLPTEVAMACWWWRVVKNSWHVEFAGLGGEPVNTLLVLNLSLHVRSGEYALGYRGPRLGKDNALWDDYTELEIVRRQGLTLQLATSLPESVAPWPKPPSDFEGPLWALPRSGADVRIRAEEGLGDDSMAIITLLAFSVDGHDMFDPGWEVQWMSSGIDSQQEAVEAERCAQEAEALRRQEEDECGFYSDFDDDYH